MLIQIPNRFLLFRTKKNIILFALFLLSILSKFFSYYDPLLSIEISLKNIPLMMIGIVFGPTLGFFSGAFSDLIGFYIFPSIYPFSWLFCIQTSLIAFISGFVFHHKNYFKTWISYFILSIYLLFIWIFWNDLNFYKLLISTISIIGLIFSSYLAEKNKKNFSNSTYINLIVTTCITSFICSFILGPIFMNIYLNNGSIFSFSINNSHLFINRIIKEAIKIPISIFLIKNLLSTTK